jgi:hypothetical protein
VTFDYKSSPFTVLAALQGVAHHEPIRLALKNLADRLFLLRPSASVSLGTEGYCSPDHYSSNKLLNLEDEARPDSR